VEIYSWVQGGIAPGPVSKKLLMTLQKENDRRKSMTKRMTVMSWIFKRKPNSKKALLEVINKNLDFRIHDISIGFGSYANLEDWKNYGFDEITIRYGKPSGIDKAAIYVVKTGKFR